MGLKDLVEDIWRLILGSDKFDAKRMLSDGQKMYDERRPGHSHVYADYFFLAACYASAAGDEELVKDAVSKLKGYFPNYNPAKRLCEEVVDLGKISKKDEEERNATYETFKNKLGIIIKMNTFCDTHETFSFGDALGKYFPSAKKMKTRITILKYTLKGGTAQPEQDGN